MAHEDLTSGDIDPICVPCHLCFANCGQGCRWMVSVDEPFHDRRVARARTLTDLKNRDHEAFVKMAIDVWHAMNRGRLCDTKEFNEICSRCGSTVAKLLPVPADH